MTLDGPGIKQELHGYMPTFWYATSQIRRLSNKKIQKRNIWLSAAFKMAQNFKKISLNTKLLCRPIKISQNVHNTLYFNQTRLNTDNEFIYSRKCAIKLIVICQCLNVSRNKKSPTMTD